MAERNWEDELQQFLKGRFRALADRFFMQVPSGLLKIAPPLHEDEAKWFILGLEAGLFAIDAEGFVDCLLVPAPDDQVNRERLRIFLADSLPPRLSRETVCLLSTAGSLVLKHGWLPRQIELWPRSDDDRVTSGVDLVVKSLGGELLAGVEVKRTAPELTKLKSDLNQCCKRAGTPRQLRVSAESWQLRVLRRLQAKILLGGGPRSGDLFQDHLWRQ